MPSRGSRGLMPRRTRVPPKPERTPALPKGREDRGAAREHRPGAAPSSAILDAAFRKAYRSTPRGDSMLDRARRRARLKVIRSSAVIIRHLGLERRPFRGESVTEFQRTLVDRRFGPGALDHALRRVGRAEERIRGLTRDSGKEIERASTMEQFGDQVRAFYGRVASFVREVDPDLRMLRQVHAYLDERPRLDPQVPTVVVAGFPNVGKSSLVAKLSSATPKVADYPFTTLALAVGHADLGFDRLQVLDTPGVLGRARLNEPEAESDSAVRRAASVVLFVIDPTSSCGFPVPEQERLLERWRAELPRVPFLVVETKSDLERSPSSRLRVSAVTGEGLEALRVELQRLLAGLKAAAPPAPVADWGDWDTAAAAEPDP